MEVVIGIGLLAILGVVAMIASSINGKATARRADEERRIAERAEEQRLKDCGEVVLFFANHLGYIARQVISRGELDRHIDAGLSGSQLAAEIPSLADMARDCSY